MFSCTECSKTFTSQSSLNRHLQNHLQNVKHTCNICGVFFRRRDLLTRHLKLHDRMNNNSNDKGSNTNFGVNGEGVVPDELEGTCAGADVVGDASTASPGHTTADHSAATTIGPRSGTASRKRCHTACNRCRDLKIKCNGGYPCTRCLGAGKACEFNQPLRSSGRVSQVHSATIARASSSVSTSLASAPSPAADAGFTCHISTPPAFSPTSFTDVVPDQDAAVSGNLHEQRGNHSIETAFGVSTLPWDTIFDQVMPWPWLHETQFLSRDEPDVLDSDASRQISHSGNYMFDPHINTFEIFSAQSKNSGKERDLIQAQSQPHFNVLGSCANNNLASAAPAASIPPLAISYVPAIPSPPSQDEDRDTRSPYEITACKQRAVDNIISLATQAARNIGGKPVSYPRPAHIWSQASQDLAVSFKIELQSGCEQGSTTTEAALRHFVRLYSEHFHQLWPLLPRRTLESGMMHPLLYLVLASIGAMYMGGSGSECGTSLHNAVRQRLVQPMDLDDSDENLIWLAQARLLVQVAALYFGQPRAFSYAQHLGTLLTAQARRMRLFSENSHQQQVLQLEKMRGHVPDALCLDLWLSTEERRRLAFGIFRGDTFTSVLLNIKPLLSLEEIALKFPTCNSVFNGRADLEPRFALDVIEHHRSPYQDVRASDVFHVLLESNELLPPLEPVAHEILLFGLQSHVWRFSYDRQLLERLTTGANTAPGVGTSLGNMTEECSHAIADFLDHDSPEHTSRKRRRDTFTSDVDSLDNRSYQMADLVGERQRLVAAMAKWERALPLAKTLARNEEDRSYLLSSLILYHLSFMRLYAPVDDIHQIHYRLANEQSVPQEVVDNVLVWKRSAKARMAVKRVRSVWSLIIQETQRDQIRSQFNFNAYIGLHHSAGILWAYHGAVDQGQTDLHLSASGNSDFSSVRHSEDILPALPSHADKVESMGLLQKIEGLFHAMSPARWSSFAEVARALTTLVFPTHIGPVNDESQSC